MKKIMTIAAAFLMAAAFATAASADSIDPMGTACISIGVPASSIATVAASQVSFDSNGISTANTPSEVTVAAETPAGVNDPMYCLDSSCVSNLKM